MADLGFGGTREKLSRQGLGLPSGVRTVLQTTRGLQNAGRAWEQGGLGGVAKAIQDPSELEGQVAREKYWKALQTTPGYMMYTDGLKEPDPQRGSAMRGRALAQLYVDAQSMNIPMDAVRDVLGSLTEQSDQAGAVGAAQTKDPMGRYNVEMLQRGTTEGAGKDTAALLESEQSRLSSQSARTRAEQLHPLVMQGKKQDIAYTGQITAESAARTKNYGQEYSRREAAARRMPAEAFKKYSDERDKILAQEQQDIWDNSYSAEQAEARRRRRLEALDAFWGMNPVSEDMPDFQDAQTAYGTPTYSLMDRQYGEGDDTGEREGPEPESVRKMPLTYAQPPQVQQKFRPGAMQAVEDRLRKEDVSEEQLRGMFAEYALEGVTDEDIERAALYTEGWAEAQGLTREGLEGVEKQLETYGVETPYEQEGKLRSSVTGRVTRRLADYLRHPSGRPVFREEDYRPVRAGR